MWVFLTLSSPIDGTTSQISSKHNLGEKVDPVLPLILAHPEAAVIPDSNTALTAEELAELGSQAVQIIASFHAIGHVDSLLPEFPKICDTPISTRRD
jgi:hypothetical protein